MGYIKLNHTIAALGFLTLAPMLYAQCDSSNPVIWNCEIENKSQKSFKVCLAEGPPDPKVTFEVRTGVDENYGWGINDGVVEIAFDAKLSDINYQNFSKDNEPLRESFAINMGDIRFNFDFSKSQLNEDEPAKGQVTIYEGDEKVDEWICNPKRTQYDEWAVLYQQIEEMGYQNCKNSQPYLFDIERFRDCETGKCEADQITKEAPPTSLSQDKCSYEN